MDIPPPSTAPTPPLQDLRGCRLFAATVFREDREGKGVRAQEHGFFSAAVLDVALTLEILETI